MSKAFVACLLAGTSAIVSSGCVEDPYTRNRDAEAARADGDASDSQDEEEDAEGDEGDDNPASGGRDAGLDGGSNRIDGGAGRDSAAAPSRDAAASTTSGEAGSGSMTGSQSSGCGGLGQVCCGSEQSCGTELACLSGKTCTCARDLFGSYVIRTDGVVLQMPTTATGAQTPIVDPNTAQPLTGAVNVYDGPSYDGYAVGCLARTDGTAWCWRSAANGNSAGSLGNGTTDTNGATFRASQVLTAANTPLTNVQAIVPDQSCAITKDKRLFCWGDLTWLVNNGTTLHSGYAQAITTDGSSPLGGVLQASLAGRSPCALLEGASSNEVWCWGQNNQYDLGLGDNVNRRYPVKVAGLDNPKQVVTIWNAYGAAHCAIDGVNVKCWGYNGYGQAGTGDTNSPVRVPTLVKIEDRLTPFEQAVALYSGETGGCALRSGGTLWCWGNLGMSKPYALNLGFTNVVAAGGGQTLRYLTNDGLYHFNMVIVSPKCGSLQ